MSTKTALLTSGILLAGVLSSLATIKADIDGATLGKWTMDLDAAKKTAIEKNMPILLNFSGSDWSTNCLAMDSKVFSTPEWAEFAKANLIQVLIDTPKDKTLVPEKYVKRNITLNEDNFIDNFPTIIVLDSDGETDLGRITYTEDITLESFKKSLNKLLKFSTPAKLKFVQSLTPAAQEKLKEIQGKVEDINLSIDKKQNIIGKAQTDIDKLAEDLMAAEIELREFRIAQLSEAEQARYKVVKDSFDTKQEAFTKWIESDPEHTPENEKIFQKMQNELIKLNGEIEGF